MNIEEYLFKNDISKTKLAEQLNVTARYLYGVISGRFPLSKKIVRGIELFTNGEVKEHEILKYNKENIKK